MTIRLNTTTTLLVIAVAIILTWFLCSRCNNNPNTLSRKTYDSLLLKKEQDEKQSGIVIDSLVSVINKRGIREDSLSKATRKLGDQLEVKSLAAKSLATQVQLYSKYKDTVELLRAAPLLADEVIVLSEKVDEYKKVNENLYNSLDSTKETTTLLLKKRDSMYNELNGQFGFLSLSYSKLDYNNSRTEKKLKNRNGLAKILGTAAIILGVIVIAK